MAGDHGDGSHTLLWVIFAVLLAVLLVALISLVLDAYHRSNNPVPAAEAVATPGGALAILDSRYASGELGRRDYLRARADILGTGAAP